MRLIVALLFLSIVFTLGGFLAFTKLSPKPPLETKFVQPEKEASLLPQTSGVVIRQPPESYLLKSPKHVYQTFNNCGPATLAMILSWYGIDKSQQELGLEIRPYQNPKGDNDDKTIFAAEFVLWAQKYGLTSLYRVNRVNGSIEILKLFASNDIPVIVKTWLRVNEDIGHFRIVKGFDEGQKVIIQDDSYHGPNKKISYFDFLSLWQPFNYTYILVYPKEKQEVVEAILGKGKDEYLAFEKALRRAEEEAKLTPENLYPLFNTVTSSYYLSDYQRAVEVFEKIENKLPRRMLWYQIEPILAYQKVGRAGRVLEITEKILNRGNRAFSELYQIRGEVYLAQGNKEAARREFELAVKYNKNFIPAQEALKKL